MEKVVRIFHGFAEAQLLRNKRVSARPEHLADLDALEMRRLGQ
jgi:hypothetical protein